MLFQPHESKPWNPWIAKVFHRRGIIETWGRGTLKAQALIEFKGAPKTGEYHSTANNATNAKEGNNE